MPHEELLPIDSPDAQISSQSGLAQPEQTTPPSLTNKNANAVIGIVIFLLVAFALYETYRTSSSSKEKDNSDLSSGYYHALEATKSAYFEYSPTEPTSDKPPTKKNSIVFSSAQARLVSSAIKAWEPLAKPSHPQFQRKLGITLCMFGKKDGLEQLLMASRTTTTAPKQNLNSKPRSSDDVRVSQMATSDSMIRSLTSDEEVKLWRSLYAQPVPVHLDSKKLQSDIRELKLGWFENIVLERLYSRTGQTELASKARSAARESAGKLNAFGAIEGWLLILGILLWLVGAILAFLRWAAKTDPSLSGLRARVGAGPFADIRENRFSYRARTTAFAVYLGTFLLIRFPLRVLIPYARHLSVADRLRFTSVLQLSLYLPVVLFAIWVLRSIDHRERALEHADRVLECKRRSLAETLRDLGLVSQDPSRDFVSAVQSYSMAIPIYLVAASFSYYLFRSIHTPVNPVQFETMAASRSLDQVLMLLETAVAAPIVEELMFRGLLFPALRSRWGIMGGMVFTSAIFALLHPNLPAGFLPLWTLGMLFVIVFQRRQSLLPGILMHAFHNGYITITMFLIFSK